MDYIIIALGVANLIGIFAILRALRPPVEKEKTETELGLSLLTEDGDVVQPRRAR